MATLIFDAENGTDGVALTQANVPLSQAPTAPAGSVGQFDNVAAANGSLGYYFSAASAAQQLYRIALTAGLIQSYRFAINFPSVPGGLRVFHALRNSSPGQAMRFRCAASAGQVQLSWVDAAIANPVTMTQLLTVATWYDLSVVVQANAAGGTNDYSINLYELNDATPINPTPYVSTGYNVGTTTFTHFDLGFNDTVAGSAAMYVDNLKIVDGSAVEQGPFQAGTALGSRRVWDGTQWR